MSDGGGKATMTAIVKGYIRIQSLETTKPSKHPVLTQKTLLWIELNMVMMVSMENVSKMPQIIFLLF